MINTVKKLTLLEVKKLPEFLLQTGHHHTKGLGTSNYERGKGHFLHLQCHASNKIKPAEGNWKITLNYYWYKILPGMKEERGVLVRHAECLFFLWPSST